VIPRFIFDWFDRLGAGNFGFVFLARKQRTRSGDKAAVLTRRPLVLAKSFLRYLFQTPAVFSVGFGPQVAACTHPAAMSIRQLPPQSTQMALDRARKPNVRKPAT
jgi:hypothetical protein